MFTACLLRRSFYLIVFIFILPLAAFAAEDLVLKESAESLQFTVDEGSWVSVSILPDDDSFVFDLLGDIYRLDIDSGETAVITSGMGFDSQPVVSPDGSKIAFISDRDGKDNLWIANIDGGNPIKLSSETYAALISPTWNPDGQNIVVTKRAREIELVQFNLDGGTGVVIEQIDDDGDTESAQGVGAEYSPDGNHL